MAHPVARLAILALLIGTAACVGSEPSSADPASALLSRFQDPFGRSPVGLSLGAHVRISYVDSLFASRSPMEQRQQAQAIARSLWSAFAGARGVDTVSVVFTDRPGGGLAAAQKTTRTFLFYPEQLSRALRSPTEAAAP